MLKRGSWLRRTLCGLKFGHQWQWPKADPNDRSVLFSSCARSCGAEARIPLGDLSEPRVLFARPDGRERMHRWPRLRRRA